MNFNKLFEDEAMFKRVEKIDHGIHLKVIRMVVEVIEKEGPVAGVSVSCNLITSLLAAAIMMVEKADGDPDQFLDSVLDLTRKKYRDSVDFLTGVKKAH